MTHRNTVVPCLVQDGPHILGHEVHAQDCDGAAPRLRHAHSLVSHDQAVRYGDVGPACPCTGEHALHLGVHVEVGNDTHPLGLQQLQAVAERKGCSRSLSLQQLQAVSEPCGGFCPAAASSSGDGMKVCKDALRKQHFSKGGHSCMASSRRRQWPQGSKLQQHAWNIPPPPPPRQPPLTPG